MWCWEMGIFRCEWINAFVSGSEGVFAGMDYALIA
jgi:hypothetical protein